MKKTQWIAALGVTGLALAGLSAPAVAGPNVSFGIYVGAPVYDVYVPPPVIYAPAPVYYALPPRVHYAPRPYYYDYAPMVQSRPGRHKGWHKHHHH
ncbi:MAG: hypothetical protein ACREUW_19785 [Burkholderiales bacterium]